MILHPPSPVTQVVLGGTAGRRLILTRVGGGSSVVVPRGMPSTGSAVSPDMQPVNASKSAAVAATGFNNS
jgi:hypothetical protein